MILFVLGIRVGCIVVASANLVRYLLVRWRLGLMVLLLLWRVLWAFRSVRVFLVMFSVNLRLMLLLCLVFDVRVRCLMFGFDV